MKKLFFKLHYIGKIIGNIAWLYSKNALLIQYIIILSWLINKNRCIVSQMEYYLTGETFMGKGPKYYVNKNSRYIFYINSILASIYHFYYLKNSNLYLLWHFLKK